MSQALHYPTIEFNDQDAFKRSLLVWDRLHRIVPNGYVNAIKLAPVIDMPCEAVEIR